MSTRVPRTPISKGNELRTEPMLLAAACDGDRQAFEALVLPCQAAILRWLTRLTRDRSTAEELFQESLFKAYVSLSGFRGDASFSTWLASIARNTYLAWRKVQQKRPDFLPLDDENDLASGELIEEHGNWAPHSATPEEQLWHQELASAIRQSLDALPEPLREAFEQREEEGLSYAEIAQNQQVPIGTVRSRIFRAREAIAHDLKHLMEPA